jgi:CheY-like chemotaxis protein
MGLATASRPAARVPPAPPLRVLVVDDCPVNRLLACALLSQWGIDPAVAAEGAQAVALAGEAAFDLILMDVDMPVMNGLEATEQIRRFAPDRATRPDVPVVAFTAGPFPSSPDELQVSGLDAVLRKPCDAAEMAGCLQRLCPDRFDAVG